MGPTSYEFCQIRIMPQEVTYVLGHKLTSEFWPTLVLARLFTFDQVTCILMFFCVCAHVVYNPISYVNLVGKLLFIPKKFVKLLN